MEKTLKIVKVLGVFLLLTIGLKHQGYAQFPVFDSLLKAGKYNTIGEIQPGGFALTTVSRKGDFYLENGKKIVIHGYSPTQIRRGKYGYFHFQVNQRWGLTDSLFRVVIPPEYDEEVTIVSPEYFIVKKGEYEGLFHISGKMIFPIEYKKVSTPGKLPANTKTSDFGNVPVSEKLIAWILTDKNNRTWYYADEKKWEIPVIELDDDLESLKFLKIGNFLFKVFNFNNEEWYSFSEMFRLLPDGIQYLSGKGYWEKGILSVDNQPLDTTGTPLLSYPVLYTRVLSPEYISCVKELEGIPEAEPLNTKPVDENPIGNIICIKPESEVRPPVWQKVTQLIRLKDKKVLHEIPFIGYPYSYYFCHEQQLICVHNGKDKFTSDTLYALDEEGKYIQMRLESNFNLTEYNSINGLFSIPENNKEKIYNYNLETNGIQYNDITKKGGFLICYKEFSLNKNYSTSSGVQQKPFFKIRIEDYYKKDIKREKKYILIQNQKAYYTSRIQTLSILGFPTHRVRLMFNDGKTKVVRASKVEEAEDGYWVWHRKGKKESVFDMDGNCLVDAVRVPENENSKTHLYRFSDSHIQRKVDNFVIEGEKWYAKNGNSVIEIPENYRYYLIPEWENFVNISHKEPIIYYFVFESYTGAVDTSGQEILPPVYRSIDRVNQWYILKKSEKEFELRDTFLSPLPGGQYEYIQSSWYGQNFIMKKSGKTGVFSMDLKPLIPAEYDEIILSDFWKKGYFILKKGSKMGLINYELNVKIPVEYDSIYEVYSNNNLKYRFESPFVFVGKIKSRNNLDIYFKNGTLISSVEYSETGSSPETHFLPVKKGRKWKTIHTETGKEIYNNSVSGDSWGLAYYSYDKNKYGSKVKTLWGRSILSRTQNVKLNDLKGYLVVQKANESFEIMDTTGKVLFSHLGIIYTESGFANFYPVKYQEKLALLDLRTFQLGQFEYDGMTQLGHYTSSVFWAVSNGNGGLLNTVTGEWIIQPGPYRMGKERPKGCDYRDCSHLILTRKDTVSPSEAEATRLWPEEKGNEYVRKKVIDLNTRQTVQSPYNFIGKVEHNLAPVSDGKKVGVMDNLNRLVIPLEWDNVEILDSNFLATYKDCKWAVYDRQGKQIQPLSFDVLMKEREYPVYYFEWNNRSGYLNANGENLFEIPLDSVISGKYIKLFKGNKMGLGNYSGKPLLPVIYDKIEEDDYINDFIITLNGKKGIWSEEKGEVLPCMYDDITLDGDVYILNLSEKKGFYFLNSGLLTPCEYNDISIEYYGDMITQKLYFLQKVEGTQIVDETESLIYPHIFGEVNIIKKVANFDIGDNGNPVLEVTLDGKRYYGIKVVDKWRLFEVKGEED